MKTVKRRYLAVSVDSDEPINSQEFMSAVWDAVSKLFGEYGASQTGLSLIDYDEAEKFAVLRTWHKTLEMVRVALASITRIGGKLVALHVLTISGTIKALHAKLERSQPH